MVTSVRGTTAPFGSAIVPRTDVLDSCPLLSEPKANTMTKAVKAIRHLRMPIERHTREGLYLTLPRKFALFPQEEIGDSAFRSSPSSTCSHLRSTFASPNAVRREKARRRLRRFARAPTGHEHRPSGSRSRKQALAHCGCRQTTPSHLRPKPRSSRNSILLL